MPSWRMANTFCVASTMARPAHSEAIQSQLYELGRAAVSMRSESYSTAEWRARRCSESSIGCSERASAAREPDAPYSRHEHQN